MNGWTVEETLSTDVLVAGGGFAGMHAAWAASRAGAATLLVSGGKIGGSGASAVSMSVHRFAPGHPKARREHFLHMTEAGWDLNDPRLVEELVARAEIIPDHLANFVSDLDIKTINLDGRDYPYFAASPRKRGAALGRPIRKHLEEMNGLTLLEGWSICHLEEENHGWQVWFMRDRALKPVRAKSLVLATGGYPGIFAHSSGTADLVGDGLALAMEAGLTVMDMEMVQFYPYRIRTPRVCDIFPDIFSQGAEFLNENGRRFMEDFPGKELENRDVLAREIYKQGGAILDLSRCDPDFLRTETPRLHKLKEDFPDVPLRVYPLTHFSMGGIRIDAHGRTGRPGILACGEIAAGVHGANRLAGHALSETLVFGLNAGKAAAEYALGVLEHQPGPDLKTPPAVLPELGEDDPGSEISAVKDLLWHQVGLIRTEDGLTGALARVEERIHRLPEIKPARPRTWLTLKSALTVAEVVINSAILRRESRGAHFRSDYPGEDSTQRGNYYYRDGQYLFANTAK